jgi:hypothetical protein
MPVCGAQGGFDGRLWPLGYANRSTHSEPLHFARTTIPVGMVDSAGRRAWHGGMNWPLM